MKMSAMREFSQDCECAKLVERERNSLRSCIMTGLDEAISGVSHKCLEQFDVSLSFPHIISFKTLSSLIGMMYLLPRH